MNGSALAALAGPLQDFQRLHTATLRRFGHQAVDLSFPSPSASSADTPYQALGRLAARATSADLRYSPFGGFTIPRRSVAATLTQLHSAPYTYRDVILTPGAAAALNLALSAMFAPPDRIMIVTPCWMDYPLYLARLGLAADIVAADDAKHLDLDAIRSRWTRHTRGLILSQPASPTGVCYKPDQAAQLAQLLAHWGDAEGPPPLLINDETHRDETWAGQPARSLARAYPHTLTVYSFGKAWRMQGQRIGYLAVHPEAHDREAIRDRLALGMRTSGLCAPNALSQQMVTALAGYAPHPGSLAELQRHARARLRLAGYHLIEAQATPFIYARAPADDDGEFTRRAAERGILVMPSRLFHEPGFFRVALNTGGAALDHALDVLHQLGDSQDVRHA